MKIEINELLIDAYDDPEAVDRFLVALMEVVKMQTEFLCFDKSIVDETISKTIEKLYAKFLTKELRTDRNLFSFIRGCTKGNISNILKKRQRYQNKLINYKENL